MSGRYQGLTLVRIPAQLELTLSLSAQLKLTMSSIQPKSTRGCVPRVLKLSSNVSDVFPKVLKLSSEVSECNPLVGTLYKGWERSSHRGVLTVRPRQRGKAVQVDPIKSTLTAPGTQRLKEKHDEPLSSLAFKFNLRRYNVFTAASKTSEVGRRRSPVSTPVLKAPGVSATSA